MHIHIDPVGGAAGDMFVAALLNAFPHLEAETLAAVRRVAPVQCDLFAFNDGVLSGARFGVAREHAGKQGVEHHHRHWSDIRLHLLTADLAPTVRDHAVSIFTHLAEAEAEVHGIAVGDVAFHEVGAWDSIADIVAAAALIVATGATCWSVGALPLGSGRVQTAHGLLPVPAPATAILLRGFETIDDNIPGERVTPTGVAILRHLRGSAVGQAPRSRVLGRSGLGFGTRTLPGLSNCLRVLVFDEVEPQAAGSHRELAVIEFEVDDQSPEDLAMGLDRLRAHQDIFDVVQMPVFGKKGRMMMHVRVLARVDAVDEAIAACFRETTTIGLRHHVVSGAALPRDVREVEIDGAKVRVKRVDRPGGRTAKAEAADALARRPMRAVRRCDVWRNVWRSRTMEQNERGYRSPAGHFRGAGTSRHCRQRRRRQHDTRQRCRPHARHQHARRPRRVAADAVLLDINLGPGPSFKLAAHLKDSGIPFIFMTGYDQELIPAEFGTIERLEKPVQLRDIVGVISRLLKP